MNLVAFGLALSLAAVAQAQSPGRAVIAAGKVLDGRGGVIESTRIVVENGRIISLDPRAEPVTHDLRAYTVMPGWIDSHVHITWGFGADGKVSMGDTTRASRQRSEENARATLLAGFTTVQSLGSPLDTVLRNSIERGAIPGPRILTALNPFFGTRDQRRTPDELRALVRARKQAGVDVIKIFAAGGMEEGTKTLSSEQLEALCGEARAQGIRTVVHAYRDAVPAAVAAGCSQIEHGLMASDADLTEMARRGVYLDPQGGLLIETYFRYKDRYLDTPPYTEEAFASVQRMLPAHHDLLKRASRTPGLKIVFGSDALAGVHGHNAEEFIHRVRFGGVTPMAALVSANSVAAEALGMADRIGAIAPGLAADLIALDGDPLTDLSAVTRVVFVMRDGRVYRNAQKP